MAHSQALLLLSVLSLLGSGCTTTPTTSTAAPPGVSTPPPAASASIGMDPKRPIFRLPQDVRPERQVVELEVVPEHEGFTGRVIIQLRLLATRGDVWVSSRGLQFSKGRLLVGGEALSAHVEVDDGIGAARVVLPRPVGPGPATLELAFSGSFNQQLAGLYRVKAADRWYAFTQFEAIDARRAFPCFDEPGFKIPWDVTLIVPAGDVAVSNTNVLGETQVGTGLKRVTFQTTRPLPSYLVAVAVGEFDVVQPPALPPNEVRHRPLQLRGVATKGRAAELDHSLRVGAELLVVLERWFGLEYPYEKLDYIAVPDYQYGAMENAGAITFAEYLLLVDPKNASERQKLSVAVVLAHEMAHQWFGDLVTMAWWDDLWLNESFATFVQGQVVPAWNPALRYDLVFLGEVQTAMGTDGLASTKPIRPTIIFEPDIFDLDSDVVYSKGASVIGMFEEFLGEKPFRSAIRSYLQSHADGNATLDDLLSALSTQVAGVGPAFRSFIEAPGVPLVGGQLQCRGSKASIGLRQSRFRPLGSEVTGGLWKVPVCARAEGTSASVCTLLTQSRGDLQLGGKRCPRWIALNPGAAGYYRWTLPSKQLQALLSASNTFLGPAERLSLGSNLAASFEAGGMDAADVVTGLQRFAADEEPAVASQPADFLMEMRRNVISPEARPQLEAYARQLYRPVLTKLGWQPQPEEPAPVRTFRGYLVAFLALRAADEEVLSRAAGLAEKYLGVDGHLHPEAVDPNLVGPALRAAAALGDAHLFDVMLNRFEKAVASDVRVNLLLAFASFRDPALALRARSLTFDPRLHTDERSYILSIQLQAPETHADAWTWMQAHFAELLRALVPNHLNYLMEAAAGCSVSEATQLEALRGAVRAQGGTYALDKALEATRLCTALAGAQRPKADAFFRKAPVPGQASAR
jgi:cytosol alanyl aminopeptidase